MEPSVPKREQERGLFIPIIDRNKCEGKATCVPVCPHDVFEMGILPKEERGGLSMKGTLKGFVHRWEQVFIVQENACTACGLCVQSCPEKAIKLKRVTA